MVFLATTYNCRSIHCKENAAGHLKFTDLARFAPAVHSGASLRLVREPALDRKFVRMGVQLGRKPFAASVLLAVAALLPPGTGAQQLTGSLAGTLTDSHSAPLKDVTITLRNAITGSAVTSKTTRGGRYSFRDLAQGEYTLAASDGRGTGEVGGIVVSPGHVSRVQTVIEFAVPHAAVLSASTVAGSGIGPQTQTTGTGVRELLARLSGQLDFRPQSTVVESSFPLASLAVLPVVGGGRSSVHLTPELSASAVPLAAVLRIPIAGIEPVTLFRLQGSEMGARFPLKPQISAARLETAQHDSETLESAQLEALPKGSEWASVRTEPSVSSDDTETERGRSADISPHINVDRLRVGTAFGIQHRGWGEQFAMGESAISAISTAQRAGSARWSTSRMNHDSMEIETKRGTDRLHGQMFLSTRQRILAAQNPFTRWVKETAPASGARVPVFTAEPYTPQDVEMRWGGGVGGALHGRRLFWFGALDGYKRSNPTVAAARHPDRFFAQPTNDQMQLLSAQLGLSGVDPVSEGVAAYSELLESLAGLLGPTPRSSMQLSGFGRLDWAAGERHRFTLEANGSRIYSPGGVSARAWQAYGTQSLGSANMSSGWMLGRWSDFVTPNLLATAQGSVGRHVQSLEPATPSAFEQSLKISSWKQLPEIVVDARDGFTIGNPAHFGSGRYPDESVFSLEQQVRWVHGKFTLDLGAELTHEVDATNRLLNQTGTYHYATIEDFASDALAFFTFGISGQLNPMDRHNCDQRGKSWRDAAGVLHGLGFLPCYSYYSQTMGPSEWWLSTNDLGGYASSQWRPVRSMVFTLATRWDLQQLPPPISKLKNLELPLTQSLPNLGSEWGPRVGFAWGAAESHWPVLRLGYGMYFGRTPNAQLESALTQTGSAKGDLNFFMRPTDNLHGGGAPPFPYVMAGEPGAVVKPGAVEYAPSFRNGEVHQAEVSLQQMLPGRIHMEASGVATLARRLPVTMDANIDPAMNPKTITYEVIDGNGSGPIKAPQITVPFFASWPSPGASSGFGGRLNPNYQQVSEIFSRANSTYEALLIRLSRNAHGLTFRARYSLGHAADWNPDESPIAGGPSVLDPIDMRQEYGTSDLDVRHTLSSAVIVQPNWKVHGGIGAIANGWMLSGVGHLNSGLPYSMRTSGSLAKEFNLSGQAIVGLSTGMNGYGGENRVYGVGRNTYRYPATWKADLRVAKRFNLGQMRQLELMAESFNLFNHQNVTEIETVGYSIEQGTLNGAMPRLNFLTGLKSGQTEFGKPLNINATDSYRERQFQFGARMRF